MKKILLFLLSIMILYGINHVLTPVRIKSILYSGENVSLKEEDEVYLAEPFFYITEETPKYLEIYGENSIVANEYEPIEKGKTYVMFLTYEPSEIYDYEGKATLATLGLREAVYSIGENKLLSKAVDDDRIYQQLWQEVNEKYGNIELDQSGPK